MLIKIKTKIKTKIPMLTGHNRLRLHLQQDLLHLHRQARYLLHLQLLYLQLLHLQPHLLLQGTQPLIQICLVLH